MYRKFLLFVLVYTLFSFKLSILGKINDDGGAGILSSIRVDDVFLLIFICIYFVKGGGLSFFLNKKPVVWFLVYIFICILSSFYNSMFGEVSLGSSLLFALRSFEYLLYIFLGYELARNNICFDRILKVYVFYCLVLIAGQSLGIIGGVSNFSFNRAIANTGGPWELAAIAGFLTSYFVINKSFGYGAISFVILLLTQSRITLVATLFSLFIFNHKIVYGFFKNKKTIVGILSLIVLTLSFLCITNISSYNNSSSATSGIAERFSSLGNSETISTVEKIITTTKAAQNKQDYYNKTYGDGLTGIINDSGNGDASAFIRITRWVTLIKTASNDIISSLIGLGPSYAGKAVDGNYVRLFIETGLLGLFFYIVFIISSLKNIKSKFIVNYVMILAITATFIDIFVTFKAMFLFWMFYGNYLYHNNNIKKRI